VSAAANHPRAGLLLFGGTFDPPHLAHTRLASAAAEQLGAARILFIPAAHNPLKLEEPAASDADRLVMLHLAIEPICAAEISTVELDRGGQSYFIDTLDALHDTIEHAGGARFLIGVDQALHFHRWKDWPQILARATPAVMLRPPWDRASFEKALHDHFTAEDAQRWLGWTLDLPLMDISATEIRRRLRAGGQLDDLLDPRVEQYMREHGLYASNGA
jgi:nicotinate-nucleotide adenylyltransferase